MPEHNTHDEMLPEYDFSQGEHGKYAKQYASGSNVVLLAPDVAEAFPTAEAVNNTLRALAQLARQSVTTQK